MSFQVSTSSSHCGPGKRVRLFAAALVAALLLTVVVVALVSQGTVPGSATAARLEGDGLFDLTNVWKIHFAFEPDQWTAMEPKGGGGPFGGPGGPGRPGGPPGFGGPGGFGPGMSIAPAFLQQGDANHDSKLSREEFSALGQKWFKAWDTNKTGELDSGKVRAGLDKVLESAGANRPGARGQGGNPAPPAGGFAGNRYTYVHADLDFAGWRFQNVSIRYKGNNTYMSSSGSFKRPLKLDLNRGFKGRRLGGVTALNLHNNVNDPSGMNEPLSYRLFRDAGVPAGRTAYAKVYFTVPGACTNKYVGVYSIVENVDTSFLRSRFGTRRGALFKPRTFQVFEDMGDNWAAYERTYVAKTPVFDHEAKRVIEFSKLVSHASDAEFADRLEEFLDLDEFARFMAVTAWLSNMDSILSMGQNFYVYLHPKTQQFMFLPWDFDHSFGQFPMAGSSDDLEHLSILKPWSGQTRFLERTFKVEKFKRIYLAHMKEFSGTIFRPERISRQVDELAAVLRPAVREESPQLLARFDQIVAGKSLVTGGFGGPPPGAGRAASSSARGGQSASGRNQGSFETPQEGFGGGPPSGGPGGGFGQGMKPIKGFVVARAESVNDQLAGKSEGVALLRSGPSGPPGGRGGAGGPPGMGGPGRGGPGMFLAQAFMSALGADRDGAITESGFTSAFLKWFDSWNTDKSGVLTEDQLRAGINKDLSPIRGGQRPGPGFGAPPDGFGPPDDLDEL